MRPSGSSAPRIRQRGCNHLCLLHPPASRHRGRLPAGSRGVGVGYRGCAMLIGMGEWTRTRNFPASARSWRSGCRGSSEPSPAACRRLARSPARSVPLALLRFVPPAAHPGGLVLQVDARRSLGCFCFSAFWDSLLRGAVGRD